MYNNVLKTDKELEFPHIFQLSASAGSGKTHNLSLRYVQFLLSSDIKSNNIKTNNLNNIIAITFTNKAANEMKERILKLLKSIAIGNKQALEQVKQVICFDEDSNGAKYAFEKKASALVDNIIKNYSDFNVKTIDSFLTDIIKASLLETDIRPGFNIVMDSTAYIESALDKLLLNVNEDKEITKIFIEFVKNYTAVEGKNNFNPRSAIIKIIKELRNIENTKGKYFKVPDGQDYLIKSHNYIEKNIKNIYEKSFAADTLDTLYNCGGKLQKLANIINDYNNKLINYSGGDNSQNYYNNHNSNSAKTSKKIASKSKEIKLHNNAVKGLAKIAGMNFSSAYLLKNNVKEIITNAKNIESLEILNKLQQTWDGIRASIKNIILTVNGVKFYSYIKILKEIKKIIAIQSKNDGNIFIDELKIKVNELIRDNRVPDIYFNIGEKIYHYLIDEFQDTDRLQWENIKALVGNSIANGGTFFYVGDKKQSIYRFKGGDADLFDEVMDDFRSENIIDENNFYEEKLSYNFRSEKELIYFFNNTFNPENLILNLLNENIFNKQQNALNLINLTDSIDGLVNKKIMYLINKVYKDHIQEPPNDNYENKNSGLHEKNEREILNSGEKNFEGYVYIERILENKDEYKKNNEDINDIKNNNDVNDDNNASNASNANSNYIYGNNEDNVSDVMNSQEIKEICLDKTIDIIKDIKNRNYNYKDIAILTRTNQESSDIVLRLKHEKIPAESEQNADIRNNTLIKEVISFIKFINKPADNLSFLNFISGAIFSSIFNKSTNFSIIFKNEINNFVAQNRKKEFIYLYFKKWSQEILENNDNNNDNNTNTDNIWNYYFEPLMNSVGYYPPYDIVCMFYQKFNIYENFINDSGFFMHLLELLKNREQEGGNSLESFIYFFENSKYEEKLFLVKLNSAKDAVNVLTMHKSKGLQFPVVIIPYAGIKIDSPNEIIVECLKSISAGNECEEYNQHYYNKNINDDFYYNNNDSNSYNNSNSDCIELDYADKISQDFLFSIIKDIIKDEESNLNLNLNVNLDIESDLKSISEDNKTIIESVISYIRQKSLNFIDELNLFYVTMTRAEKELYILIPPKIGNHKNKLMSLFFNDNNDDKYKNKNNISDIIHLTPEHKFNSEDNKDYKYDNKNNISENTDTVNMLEFGMKKNFSNINQAINKHFNIVNETADINTDTTEDTTKDTTAIINTDINSETISCNISNLTNGLMFFNNHFNNHNKNNWNEHLYGIIPKEEIFTMLNEDIRKRITRGNILHFILSKINTLNKDNFEALLDETIHDYISEFANSQNYFIDIDEFEQKTIANELNNIFKIKEANEWFFVKDANVKIFTEKEIVNYYGELKRIDRLMIFSDNIKVIDYKTGIPDELQLIKDKNQIDGYIGIISEMYPETAVKGYILYIDKKEVKEF